MINLVKKEKIVQNQNPRIDNKINKSVKNNKIKAPIIKKNEIKPIKKIENKRIPKTNNINIVKNIKTIKYEKNTKPIHYNNINKKKNKKKKKKK